VQSVVGIFPSLARPSRRLRVCGAAESPGLTSGQKAVLLFG
jgi:hypothetical protein